ncbi:MAG TPA: hypothetical protein PLI65_00770 [Bacteroidales bacterium]|nr:hypothetical protein [Bacteroidales bacterium]HPR57776.1 hypothetical protein [Bacteroidales bacterium]HRW95985.1 hypothetical protein [Bacteroidales bacterium]
MDDLFENLSICKILWKRKTHLILITLGGIIAAIVFSGTGFITPKFKSFAVLYPEIETIYSTEEKTEQMLQWLESRDIKDSLIKQFNLVEHYEIDPAEKLWLTKVRKEIEKNVLVSPTKFESVKIEILDQNPEIACKMVTAMIDIYNKKLNAAHRKKYREILTIEENRLIEKKMQMDSLMNCITKLRTEYGLIDYGIQSGEVMKGYLGTFDGSNSAKVNQHEVMKLKSSIESKGDSLLLLTNLLTSVTHSYNNYRISYEDALRNVTKELTFASVVTSPEPADKPCYPKRFVIVLVIAAVVFFTAFLFFLVFEKIELKKLTSNIINRLD